MCPTCTDGDHLAIVCQIHDLLATRNNYPIVSFCNSPLHHNSLAAAKLAAAFGVQSNLPDHYNSAFAEYCTHSNLVYARQTMMLNIILDREAFARENKLLTFALRPSANQLPSPERLISRSQNAHTLIVSRVLTRSTPTTFRDIVC